MEEKTITNKDYPLKTKAIIKDFFFFDYLNPIPIGIILILVLLVFHSLFIAPLENKYNMPSVADSRLVDMLFLLLITATIFLFLFYLRRKKFQYFIKKENVEIRYGIVNQKDKEVSFNLITDVFVTQGILDGTLNTATLIIDTSKSNTRISELFILPRKSKRNFDYQTGLGYWNEAIIISGLDKNDADTLKNIILEKQKLSKNQ